MARLALGEYQDMVGNVAPVWYSETFWSAAIATFIIAGAVGYLVKADEDMRGLAVASIGVALFGIIFAATGAAASGLPNDGILHGVLAIIPGFMVGALSAMAGGAWRDHRDRKRHERQEQKYAQENHWPPLRPK